MNKDMATVVVYDREFLLSTATPESLQQPTLRSREEESQTIASSVVITACERRFKGSVDKEKGDFNTILHRN